MGIFDRITGTINSAGENVAKMAKDASDVSKCNSQIDESKAKIESICTDIGKYYWKNHSGAIADGQLEQWIYMADQEEKTIKLLEEKLRQLRGVEICKNCGAELKKGANFCNICGAAVEHKKENNMQCPQCGAVLNGDEKFCMNCGAKIEHIESVVSAQKPDENECKNCGKKLRSGDAFCRFCGTPVRSEADLTFNTTSDESVEE